jgi:catechol 2,3-dioxygenase-like lactoylglutathione lyase family enzyme
MASGIFPRLDTVTLQVRDLQAAQQWYEEKLGLGIAYMGGERIVVLDTGGATSLTLAELVDGSEPDHNGTAPTPIFYTDDACMHRDMLMERGVHCDDLERDANSCFFRFYDLDGNRLEACQY